MPGPRITPQDLTQRRRDVAGDRPLSPDVELKSPSDDRFTLPFEG
jgi:hypothetical protein